MNVRTITSALIAALVGLSLGMPATTLAGERHHDRHDYGQYEGHGFGHYKRHRRHHDGHHGYGHRGRVTNYYSKRHDDDDLLIGLVVGGILGYALNSAQQRNDTGYDRGHDSSYERYPRTRSTYPATDTYAYSDSSCLQEREYQTTVIVGGRSVDAYGTACLQPDGSWKRGPAQTVAY